MSCIENKDPSTTEVREHDCFLPPYTIEAQYDAVPLAEQVPYYVQQIGEDYKKLQELGRFGEGRKICVLDTGADKHHVQVSKELANVVKAVSFVRGENEWDGNSHGSHCLGMIGAQNQGSGITGVAPKATLYSGKVLSRTGSGSSADIARGIRWAADELGAGGIINLSLGGGYDRGTQDACRYAVSKGLIVVASMGNSGSRGGGYPGILPDDESYGIAAMDKNDKLADFSSWGEAALFVGYGVDCISTTVGGRYSSFSGTSMSGPQVAATIALALNMLEDAGEGPFTQQTFLERIKPHINDLGPDGRDKFFGLGKISLDSLAASLKAPVKPVDPVDPVDPVEPPKCPVDPDKVCGCLLYTSPSPRDQRGSRMPSSA